MTIVNKVGNNRAIINVSVNECIHNGIKRLMIIEVTGSEATYRDHGVIFPDSAKEARSSAGPEGSAGPFRRRQAALGDVHIPSQSHGKWA